MKRKIAFFVVIIGLIVASVVFFFIDKGQQPLDLTSALAAEINLEPTQADRAGVDPASQFLVKTSTYIDPKIVAKNISVQPEIEFNVEEQKNTNQIKLIPNAPLAENKVYRFTLDLPGSSPLKWAFQTKGTFKVNSTLPRDQSTGVPTNTGIEVTFSHAGFADLNKYFEITPQVKGRFEEHKKTAVFVPDSLQPGTVYTVKVKKGLKLGGSDVALAEDLVFQFETQDPTQHNTNDAYIEFYNNTMEFPSTSAPVLPIGYYSAKGNAAPQVKVSFFKYQKGEDYIKSIQEREKIPSWAYFSRGVYQAEHKGLEKVLSFDTDLKKYGGEHFIELPQTLTPGYYLGEVSLGTMTRQVWVQVTDLAVYAAVGEDETLVWAHNQLNGAPLTEGIVSLSGHVGEGKTDENGLVSMPTPPLENNNAYVVVKGKDQEAVAVLKPTWFGPLMGNQDQTEASTQDYWKYIYLDRGLYQPNDTVSFWGLVKSRKEGLKQPGQLTVALTQWKESQEEVILEEKMLAVENQVFSGEMKLPNLIPGYYQITVRLDDLTLMQQGFDVQTYIKPSYRIDVETEKNAVFVGDTLDINVATACFEETPVPRVKLNYYLDQPGEITTDERGQGKITYKPTYQSEYSDVVQYRYLSINATLPESGPISTATSIIVLNNDLEIEAEGAIRDHQGQVNITTDRLTVDKVNQGEKDYWEEDAFFLEKAVRVPVTVAVFRQEWTREEDGEYYDFVNKKVVQKYRYQERRVPVTKEQVVTDNTGKARFNFKAEEEKSYYVELSAMDGNNNQTENEIFLFGGQNPQDENNNWYYLDDGEFGAARYQEGENVRLTVKNNEQKLPDRENGYLFYTAKRGIMDYRIQDTGVYSAKFNRRDIPNYWVSGVYFDGKNYHMTPEQLVAYDEKAKALDIKITTDKKEYRPQDKVQVNVEVRDQRGRPAPATVNLNLVDEALYQLSPQEVNLLGSIYSDYISSGVILTGSTHQDPTRFSGGGAEHGGEGGSGRQDFKDTAFFETIHTGADGKATVTFTVPDNLTSWRLTYQGITPDLEGMSGTAKINVRLPFFTDLVLNENYLAGDRPVINLRSLGSALKVDAQVNYRVQVVEEAGKKEILSKNLSASAFDTVPVQLPALEPGDYQITVRAAGNRLEDTITRTFQVAESYMTQEKVNFAPLTTESKVEAATNKPVTITFADTTRSQYLSALCSLAYLEGSRIEQKLAPYVAISLLQEHFEEFTGLPDELEKLDLSSYQTPDGGIAILPYGSSDLEVSVLIAPWSEEYFDVDALKSYFFKIINDPQESRERGIMALYGLTSLEEPVLQEVVLAASEKDLSLTEKLYLVLSLNQLGDEQPARKILKGLLQEYGETNGPYMQINSGNNKDDMTKLTGLTALAAGRLNFAESSLLLRYVMENPPQNELNYLEQITFIEEGLDKMTDVSTSFTYILEGKKKQVKLPAGEIHSLTLTPDKLKALSFENIQGKVGMTWNYQEKYTPLKSSSTEGVTIARDYLVAGKTTRQFNAGDLVEIKVSWNIGGKAPDGVYQITDYLPSGLKLVERPYEWGVTKHDIGWPIEVEGQKVAFAVTEKGSFNYYARIVNPGSFTAQNMTLHHVKSGKIYSMTATDRVEIK